MKNTLILTLFIFLSAIPFVYADGFGVTIEDDEVSESHASIGGSSIICLHSRVKQEGQRNGHAWASLYDASKGVAREFHFGRYPGSQFQVRSVSYSGWKAQSQKRDSVSRARCVSIGPNQVDSLWTKVNQIQREGREYNVTSNNCVTTAVSIWNATVSPSQKVLKAIAPSSLYRRL